MSTSSLALKTRAAIAGLLGQMFGGDRDMYKVFGYKSNINYREVEARYRRQDIAARIVEAPANALWSNPPKVHVKNNEAWTKAWNNLMRQHNVWKTVNRADKLAGMGEYSILVMGLSNAGKLDAPITSPNGSSRELLYLQPYGSHIAQLETLVTDTSSPRFMLPDKYSVNPGLETNTLSVKQPPTFKVDATRVIHIGENYLTDEVYGNCRTARVWNLLDDLLKVAGGTAETFWLTANRGIQIDVDKDMDLSEDDANELADEVDEYQHEQRRILRTRGVKVNVLGSDVPNPKEVFGILMSLLSGATGIPKRILLGSEAGQLASEQDRNNWAERIEERRTEFGEPVVLWPLIRMFMSSGLLPQIDEDQIIIDWPSPFQLTPGEVAMASAHTGRAVVNLGKTLVEVPEFMNVDEARGIIGLEPNGKTINRRPLEGEDASAADVNDTTEDASEEGNGSDDSTIQ